MNTQPPSDPNPRPIARAKWPKCSCMDTAQCAAEFGKPESDQLVRDMILTRRAHLYRGAAQVVDFAFAQSKELDFCSDAQLYFLAIIIASLCSKLHDADLKDKEISINNPNDVKARTYVTLANLEDMFDLVRDQVLHAQDQLLDAISKGRI